MTRVDDLSGGAPCGAPFLKRERLARIAGLVREAGCDRLIDIGCDHATVPIALLREACCQAALVTDLRPGPLAVARKRAQEEGLSEKLTVLMTDGLTGLEPEPDDVLLISGLGGDTLAGILERGARQALIPKRVILQPQTREEQVRSAMDRIGLPLTDEICLFDRGHLYLILVSDRGEEIDPADALGHYLGPHILTRLLAGEADDAAAAYLAGRLRRLKKRSPYDDHSRSLLHSFEERFPIPYNELNHD